MKKAAVFALAAVIALGMAIFGLRLYHGTFRSRIIRLYQQNEEIFFQAASSEDFDALMQLNGVIEIKEDKRRKAVDVFCGGTGIVPSSGYYGVLYLPEKDARAYFSEPAEEWTVDGNGFCYRQKNGDNRFYVEPLGNDFYYYEQHY